MNKYAIYARYSCNKQNETSLDDQIRRCRGLAARYGCVVEDELIYTDAAVSGTDKGDARRMGYQRMRIDWAAGKFHVLVVDEFSRLTRDGVEQASLVKLLERNRQIRLITADGVDTDRAEWQLSLGLQGLLAQSEVRKLSHRVNRGMWGQVDRGYMIAPPAFGFNLQREFDARQEHIGSYWVINPYEAKIVQDVFSRRASGESMHQIAAWLNSEGILCSRKPRNPDGGHWRAPRIRNMLVNPIYRGVFVWHGSTTYAAKMKAEGQPVIIEEFERPELRLVSDEIWFRCNTPSISRSGYGGGAHALGGLLNCGCCGGILAISAQRKACRSVYCPTCSEVKSSKGDETRLTSTVAVVGVQHLLLHALRYFVSDPLLEAFRQSLRLRLTGDKRAEVEEIQQRLVKLESAQARLSHMLVALTEEDPVLQERYEESRDRTAKTKAQLVKLEKGLHAVDAHAIQAQLEADPLRLLFQFHFNRAIIAKSTHRGFHHGQDCARRRSCR